MSVDVPSQDSAEGHPEVPAQRRSHASLLVALVAAGVVLVDQVSKVIVLATRADGPDLELLGGLLTLTYARNPGAAFSMGTGYTWVFTVFSIAVIALVVMLSRRVTSRWWAVTLGALLGGALGNLLDRLFRDPGFGRGHVIDWLELPRWPVFNVADMAIVTAGALIVFLSIRGTALDEQHSDDSGTSDSDRDE